MAKAKEYIAYQGDRPLGTGTVKELAKSLGYGYSTLQFNTSPTAHKRSEGSERAILLYEIEDDDEDEDQPQKK